MKSVLPITETKNCHFDLFLGSEFLIFGIYFSPEKLLEIPNQIFDRMKKLSK